MPHDHRVLVVEDDRDTRDGINLALRGGRPSLPLGDCPPLTDPRARSIVGCDTQGRWGSRTVVGG